MAKVDREMFKKVSNILSKYPSEIELSGKQMVIIFDTDNEILEEFYKFLVEKHNTSMAPYRMLVPSKIDGKHVIFVFNHVSKKEKPSAELLADAFFMKKVIFKKPISAKVIEKQFAYYESESKISCSSCSAKMYCPIEEDSTDPCFIDRNETSGLNSSVHNEMFLQFVNKQLQFETIDPSNIKWLTMKIYPNIIWKVNAGIDKVMSELYQIICDYITPNHTYRTDDITKQNDTYVRFMTVINSFRFANTSITELADSPYVPKNFEKVLQQNNIPLDGIHDVWREIIGTTGIIDAFREPKKNKLEKIILFEVQGRVKEPDDDERSDIFKQEIAKKLDHMSTNMIHTITSNGFSNLLDSLRFLIDANWLESLQRGTQFLELMDYLQRKVDRYLSESNAWIIDLWFLYHVPSNWQERLVGFVTPGQYWLMPEYEISKANETILNASLTFNEYVKIVDFYLRESTYPCEYHLSSLALTEKMADSLNFTQFFDTWKLYTKSMAKVENFHSWELEERNETKDKCSDYPSLSLVTLLQTKYEQSFAHMPFDTVQHIFQISLARVVHLSQDFFKKVEYLKPWGDMNNVQNVYSQRLDIAHPLFAEFKRQITDLVTQHVIRVESSKIDSVINRLGKVATETVQLIHDENGEWLTAQPYRKMIDMKYSLSNYEDFFKETKILFESIDMDIPKEELVYLESLQGKFEYIQKQAELASIVGCCSTRYNWGRGFRNDEDFIRSSGVMLKPPVNFNLKSSLEFPNIYLLMSYGAIFLYKMFK